MTLSANPRRSATHSLEDPMNKPTATQLRITLVLVVCAAQFYTSARDIVATALPHVHHDLSRAVTFPVSIDAAILAATLYAVIRTGISAKARRWAAFVRYTGFAATLYANGLASGIASADRITPDLVTGTLFLMIPAILLIGTMELVVHAGQGTAASRKAAKTNRPAATVTRLRAAH